MILFRLMNIFVNDYLSNQFVIEAFLIKNLLLKWDVISRSITESSSIYKVYLLVIKKKYVRRRKTKIFVK